jgi:cytochrome bd-type quinol oxidase subunit 2
MAMTEVEKPDERGLVKTRALVLIVVVPALLVVGIALWSLQGYQNEVGDQPSQTWPYGSVSLLLAAVLAWAAFRSRRLTRGQWVFIGVVIAVFVLTFLYGIFGE